MKPFKNPWPLQGDYNPETDARLTADIPLPEKQFWLGLDPMKGCQQTTINILLEKLFAKFKALGYTTIANAQDARDFVANVELVDGRAKPTKKVLKPKVANGKT